MIRLLCIEDQPDIQTILKLVLESQGRFQVSQAETGSDGVASAVASRPDAILLDYTLPDMDGPAVLDLLKNDARTAGIPVILLSAMTQPDDIQSCLSRGAIDALKKPFNPRTLPQQVEGLLRDHLAAR